MADAGTRRELLEVVMKDNTPEAAYEQWAKAHCGDNWTMHILSDSRTAFYAGYASCAALSLEQSAALQAALAQLCETILQASKDP